MPERYQREISKEEIAALESFSYQENITLIETAEEAEAIIPLVKKEAMIGFDTETKPAFKKGVVHQVALMQLALSDRVLVFRLNKMGLPRGLIEVLADPHIRKVGIAVRDDIIELQARKKFRPNGFVDLNVLCPELGFVNIGAKKLSALVLGIRISKRQQTSNWEASELTNAQIAYAATDAWICREIALKLQEEKLIDSTLKPLRN